MMNTRLFETADSLKTAVLVGVVSETTFRGLSNGYWIIVDKAGIDSGILFKSPKEGKCPLRYQQSAQAD